MALSTEPSRTVPTRLILASASTARAGLLRAAGIDVDQHPARIDEEAIRHALAAEGASPRDQADTLAELKARRVAGRFPDAVVIGADQVLDLDGKVLAKPGDIDAARAQLQSLRGKTHRLLSAVVLYEQGAPVWRHVGEVRLTMRQFSDAFLDDYLTREAGLCDVVGAYKLESRGARLFETVAGDYFTVLGLPLIPLLGYMGQRGMILA